MIAGTGDANVTALFAFRGRQRLILLNNEARFSGG